MYCGFATSPSIASQQTPHIIAWVIGRSASPPPTWQDPPPPPPCGGFMADVCRAGTSTAEEEG
jgi:hypothetical protein